MPELAVHEPDDQVSGPGLRFAEQEGAINPRALDNVGNIGREIRNGGGTARQLVQSGDEVGGEPRTVELEMLEDAMDIRVLVLEQLMQPVHGLHVGIAAHLAKDGGTL